MQNRNATKVRYFHFSLEVDYRETKEKKEEEEEEEKKHQLNLAHYKISLCMELGRIRL